jgi:hypothetical protein
MKYLLSALLCVCSLASAETFRLNIKVSSIAQDVAFLNDQLSEILRPAGYQLVQNSIDITEHVYHPAVPRPVIIETPRYAVRSVFFHAFKDAVFFKGSTYLLVFRHDRGLMSDFTFNSSARNIISPTWNVEATMLLSNGYTEDWFAIEVRPNNLNLHQIKNNLFTDCANILRKEIQ